MKRGPQIAPRACLGLACLLLAGLGLACSKAPQPAEVLNRDANREYSAGNFPDALEKYRRAEVLRPDLPVLNYNAGNTLSRQSDFQRAIAEQQRAVSSTDPSVQAHAYYNMGNAFVRINQLREALDAYKSALRADPADKDAKYNLEVIQRRLDQEEARRQQVEQQGQQVQQGQQSQGQPDPGAQGSAQGQGDPNSQNPGGAPQAGQTGQPAPGQQGQTPQPGQTGAGTQPGPSSASGFTGTDAGQASALDPDLKRALDQFDHSNTIDDAQRALDIVGQQERIRQAARGGSPQPLVRDW